MLVERYVFFGGVSFGDGYGNCEYGVGVEFVFVVCIVEIFVYEIIDCFLVVWVFVDECWGDDFV